MPVTVFFQNPGYTWFRFGKSLVSCVLCLRTLEPRHQLGGNYLGLFELSYFAADKS